MAIEILQSSTPLTHLQYLTIEEANQINQQFRSSAFLCDGQVMWSGVPRERAQQWADEHGMQTLTTAMGPLMSPSHPSCLRLKKSSKQWSKYVKGASILFAQYAAEGQRVTVLSPPPPQKLHPSGLTTYQSIEEPILKGEVGGAAVLRIDIRPWPGLKTTVTRCGRLMRLIHGLRDMGRFCRGSNAGDMLKGKLLQAHKDVKLRKT